MNNKQTNENIFMDNLSIFEGNGTFIDCYVGNQLRSFNCFYLLIFFSF